MSGMTTVAPRETLSQLLERLAPHGVTKTAAREALLDANPHLASAGSAEQRALPEGYLVLVPFATKGTSVRSTSNDAFARAAGLVRALSTLEKAVAKKPSAVTAVLGVTPAATTSAKPSDAVARTLQKILAALPEATRGLR
jgi:phage tail protein X